jgi:hypothetical protein
MPSHRETRLDLNLEDLLLEILECDQHDGDSLTWTGTGIKISNPTSSDLLHFYISVEPRTLELLWSPIWK